MDQQAFVKIFGAKLNVSRERTRANATRRRSRRIAKRLANIALRLIVESDLHCFKNGSTSIENKCMHLTFKKDYHIVTDNFNVDSNS